MFRPPGRPTFVNSDKSRQKHRQEPRFLHLLARCSIYRIIIAYHAFTQDLLFRFVKRIVSAPAPLPLMPAPKTPLRPPCGGV